jgi:hypothetical protein
MNFRVVWLSGIVAGTATAAACDAPDPGEITFSERQTDPGGSSSGGGSSGGSSGSSTTDGGGSSGTDGSAKDPVFSVAFSPGTPGQNANDVAEHPAAEKPLEGKNCFKAGGCHAENNHKWGFAGTVYSTINGGATVKNANVVVANPDGTQFASVYTDDQGNFWYEGAKPPANGRVGVRDATKSKTMGGIVAGDPGGQCNSGGCHGAGTMRIYLQ